MSDKKFLDGINPERREFLEKVTKGAFIIPTVISVMMLDQKLNLTTANAQSNDFAPGPCLSFETLISTPLGKLPVFTLKPGMLVYTLDADGVRTAMPLELVSKALVPASHTLCRLVLDDGREVRVSAGHPTADKRKIGDLVPGDIIDGSVVISAEKVLYSAGFTYDLLPSGDTGYYWADGVLMASTLSPGFGFIVRRPGRREEPRVSA
ncbi:MAG: Hint domain-containing protein [Thermodesulfobacteriota bacterium]